MPFIRVKSANPEDPQHEFDVPAARAERHPERFTIVDDVPVDAARRVTHEGERSLTPDESWKVAELKDYADHNGVDLGDATKKSDILNVIAGPAD